MSICLRTALVVTVAIAIGGAAAAQEPGRTADTAKGKVLVDGKGMTLYTYDRDKPGRSSCTGVCATTWPPYRAAADAKPAGDWSIVARDGNVKQWAYKTKPLYTWEKDSKPGDVTGDGVQNVWSVAKP